MTKVGRIAERKHVRKGVGKWHTVVPGTSTTAAPSKCGTTA
jgi:hypothetical protein